MEGPNPMVKVYDYDKVEQYKKYAKKVKKNRGITEQEKDKRTYLNIWDINPSFKDISSKHSILQTVFLFIITLGIIITMYLVSQHILISVAVGLIFCSVFILIFHEEIYLLRYFFQFVVRNKMMFSPFEDLVFWYKKDDNATFYMSNRKDLVHVTMRIYQIKTIAENIHPTVYKFVKSMGSKNIRISYSYQVVQKPVIHLFNKDKTRENVLTSLQSRETTIYFAVFREEKGILTNHKRDRMEYNIHHDSATLKSNLVSNFHHFHAELLAGNALINAIRTLFLKEEVSTFKNPVEKRKVVHSSNPHVFLKFIVFMALMIYLCIVLLSLNFFVFYIIGINMLLITGIIMLWWRSLLFEFTKAKLINTNEVVIAKPFNNIHFYRIKKLPYSLFLHVENRLLIGIKLLNLKFAYYKAYCDLERFIESLNNHKINFCYTVKTQPLTFSEFYHKKGFKHLNEHEQNKISRFNLTRIERANEEEQWLGARAGMWLIMLTISIHSYKFISTLNEASFDEVEQDLLYQINNLQGAFGLNAQALEIETMKTSTLTSGYIFSILKHNLYRLNGTHLNYLMFQGARMYPLIEIADVLKKGLHIEIAAEFNTPLYLDNFITIGHTFNTEVLETEVAYGFTKEQLHNLLIMNGNSEQRQLISMKIVIELIKVKLPSIVFDFDGEWSKLFTYFEGTEFKQDILYFKYGRSFIVDPIKSDIPYDSHHTEYLEYIYDAFGLALKRSERMVQVFRHTIQKNPNMDLSAIKMALQNQSEWEKNSANDLLLGVFADFTPDDLSYFQAINKDSIVAFDFVKNKKTVIVDLSVFRDLRMKLFVALVILSKIIHNIHHNEHYQKKFVILPYIDNLFESYFLDVLETYDKIDIFLKPLLNKKFGFIFSAHQIHCLHPNALLYFNNFITLRATDVRDIAVLRNIINLQELEGMGMYSSKRKHSHQINYLKNLKQNIILTRRDDIDQPFPAIIEWEEIQHSSTISYEKIVKFMDGQGFDLYDSERKILEQAQETLFEIDLGHYFIYIEEIIMFMKQLLTIDKIGNLYKDKLKKHLKQVLYPKISEKTQNKQYLKKIIENVLEALIKHDYLVENHPRRADGGEALRTSYSVGGRYQEALDDYYKVKRGKNQDFCTELLESEIRDSQELAHVFPNHPRKHIIQEENLKEALSREIGDLYYCIFKIYMLIENKDYAFAIHTQYELIKNYLRKVYRHFFNVDTVLLEEFNSFLTIMAKFEGFPYSKQELIELIDQYQFVNLEGDHLDSLAKEIFISISIFFNRIQTFINSK